MIKFKTRWMLVLHEEECLGRPGYMLLESDAQGSEEDITCCSRLKDSRFSSLEQKTLKKRNKKVPKIEYSTLHCRPEHAYARQVVSPHQVGKDTVSHNSESNHDF